jgi:mannan endo-1,4-beta-mannosidase
MYEHFTNVHKLNNLIWVWNSPLPQGYVGDKCCDIISRDVYLSKHTHSDYSEAYDELVKITTADKIAALGETGPVPGLALLEKTKIPWTWFMTWSKDICSGKVTANEELIAAYNSNYAISLDKLPALY